MQSGAGDCAALLTLKRRLQQEVFISRAEMYNKDGLFFYPRRIFALFATTNLKAPKRRSVKEVINVLKRTKTLFLILTTALFLLGIAGCVASTNTVEASVISNEQYIDGAALGKAEQPEALEAGQDIFASVYFIESPKGMKYSGKWYAGDTELKSEEKEISADGGGVIVYSLEAEKVAVGTLRFEISYGDDTLLKKEIKIQ